jgi:hypothetical protein
MMSTLSEETLSCYLLENNLFKNFVTTMCLFI